MYAHTKKVLFATYTRIVAILLVSVVITFLVGVGLTEGMFYSATGLHYLAPDFASVFMEMSSDSRWIVLFGISIVVLAMLSLSLITFITSAAVASVLIRNTSFRESIIFGITKGLRSVPVQALFFVLLFLSSIPSFLVILIASSMANGVLAMLFLLLGMTLLLLPFLIALRSTFVIFIWLENQKMKAGDIMKKSFALTRGSVVWMMVLTLVLAGVGAAIMYPILTLVFFELAILVLPFSFSAETFSAITDQVISIFLFGPIVYALFYTLYVYAKRQSGGIKRGSA